ncbi:MULTISPECIES: MMPL family transporter [unclassified Clostridium]|uniref:efflux RND transporter permease subunit n=1 Tax=unclassified Clostridium TaxID=2614128 RepID=UPI001105F66B|nr:MULTISPECIES: MMPL family transporter [unclassified Clostridium]
MIKFGKAVVKLRIPILILAVILLIPSVLGILGTRINYDMLDYLPEDMDTVKGQNILLEDFGKGAFSLVMVEGMPTKDVSALKAQMEQVPHVETVLWYDSLADISIPMEVLPQKVYDAFNQGDTTLMAVFFDTSTSADETMQAIADIRSLAGKQCFVSGMSAIVTDLKDLCEREEPIYVGLAVLLACAAMMLFMDNYLVPFLFLGSIGMAILLNLGTNYFMGEISYITKALSAVLQLAVTMDYSIFLWHSYGEQLTRFQGDKKRAMAHAISATITSVVGSSITTVAGFIALCFMSFTLGFDLGMVMAKGVILGVIGCVTTLPAMILLFDKALQKAQHRPLLPKMDKAARLVTRRSWVFLIVFVVLLVPAFYGYMNTATYYDLGEALPKDMAYVIANTKLQEEFDMASTHMILADANLPAKQAREMLDEIGQVEGVKFALGFDSVLGSAVPEEIVPDTLKEVLKGDRYQLMLISSQYKVASDAVNNQIDQINAVLKKYDPSGMLIGEAPCTKDMIDVTDHDFKVVNAISIIAIFVIIALVLKSITLPVILVAVIELAIFINLGIPYYTGVSLPFVAPICISTIQLGATVDYAILMTTRYKRERRLGKSGHEAVDVALSASIPSILVSALGFFAATFGVALYSNVDIISSMCNLMARGAIVSMLCVLFILPAMLILFDKVIVHTSLGFKNKNA